MSNTDDESKIFNLFFQKQEGNDKNAKHGLKLKEKAEIFLPKHLKNKEISCNEALS